MDYYNKYLKYKSKYLALKYKQTGGANTYNLTVKQPWFSFIKSGKKTIEGRLNSGLFAKLKLGDCIEWSNKKLKCKTYVNYLKTYDTFADMIEQEGIKQILPNKKTIEEGVSVYRQYYSEEREKTSGVIAIGLSLREPVFHEGKLQTVYYDAIKSGTKIYEMRVYDEKRKNMQVGDIWVFSDNEDLTKDKLNTIITEIKVYKSFEEAIKETGASKLLPNIDNIVEAIKTYEAFDNGNYKINAEKLGVVRFTLKVSSSNL